MAGPSTSNCRWNLDNTSTSDTVASITIAAEVTMVRARTVLRSRWPTGTTASPTGNGRRRHGDHSSLQFWMFRDVVRRHRAASGSTGKAVVAGPLRSPLLSTSNGGGDTKAIHQTDMKLSLTLFLVGKKAKTFLASLELAHVHSPRDGRR
jgi:hypothetical protein